MTNPSITIDLTPQATLQPPQSPPCLPNSAVRIPGTSRTIGADGLLSVIPGVGSLMGTGISLYIAAEAIRHGVPPRLLTRMGLNIAADTVVGAIPGVGFLFDMAFKANQRNLALLRQHIAESCR